MEGDGFLSGGFLSDVFGDHSSDDDSFDGKWIRINVQTYFILLNGLCRVENAKELLHKLVENGVTPSWISVRGAEW